MIHAPAKINLTLEVLGKRPDGYHDISSVVQTIDLCDELCFEESKNTTYRSNLPGWDSEKSLIGKTVDIIRQITGTAGNVAIAVNKKIPLASGLGGDSSDAAATLKGLNSLWGLGLPEPLLYDIAAQLGSDVPFFIRGGTALMEGRGEKIAPLPDLKETWLVLMLPNVSRPPDKTRSLYGSLQKQHFTDGSITGRLVNLIKAGKPLTPDYLFNTFENVAFSFWQELPVYRQHILKIQGPQAGTPVPQSSLHLAGSGPTMYTVVSSKAEGEDLCNRLKSQGLQTYLTHTLHSPDIIR